jgi:predicted aspartyl protease
MTIMDNHSRSSNRKQFFASIHLVAFRPAIAVDVVVSLALTLFCSVAPYAYAASSPPNVAQNVEVKVFSAPDEFSTLVEAVRDGESFSPMGETIGPGGLKWFMVKTREGNVGWIKADDNPAIRKIDGHFRSLRNEATVIEPGSAPASTTSSKTSAGGAIVIPVKILAGHAIVPVTFNNSITANLMVDTGASRTMVSKRVARDLRLYSMGSGTGYGVGGRVTLGIGRVESIKVGEVEVQNMPVSIHDFSPDPSYEGLLGVDFLGRFHMSLDSAKQVMVLTPR